jgi:hypothetical protein
VPLKTTDGKRMLKTYKYVAAHACSGQLLLLHVPYRLDADLVEGAEVEGNNMQRSVLGPWRNAVASPDYAASRKNLVVVHIMAGVQQLVAGLGQLQALCRVQGCR